jgi:Uma2 family endonuclease
MVSATVLPRMTIAEYLEREAGADQRHELIDGEIFAMAGGSPRHAAIAAALIGALYTRLRGTSCRPTTGDQRIFIPATGSMFYAVVAVICGAYQLASADPHAVTNPTLIIEVLSASTADHDRGTKFEHYRQLPSLQEYLLVSQTVPHVDHRRRLEGDTWLVSPVTEGAIELKSLGVSIALDEIYAGLDALPAL